MAQILPHHMLSNLRSRLLKVCDCLGAVGGENPQACWQGRLMDELFAFPLLSNHWVHARDLLFSICRNIAIGKTLFMTHVA